MRDEPKINDEMDRRLKELGCLAEKEAVPDRLRELAARLREALLATQPGTRRPPDQ